MEQAYPLLRRLARRIAAVTPAPAFYRRCADAVTFSRSQFATDPISRRVRAVAAANLDDCRGHGLPHSVKVALDAGAIMAEECRRHHMPHDRFVPRVRDAHLAGLLHDIDRGHDDHASAGATHARRILTRFGIPQQSVDAICQAIAGHEAFQPYHRCGNSDMDLMSGCLYDADKFRWGPDNFTVTVWRMVTAGQVPLAEFAQRYSAALARVDSIRHTFRTATGRQYGPEFIDLGLSIGRELADTITQAMDGSLDR